jgi:hypothetical protein
MHGWAACWRIQQDEGRSVRVWELRSLAGDETRPARWIGPDEHPVAWSRDGRYAFVAGYTQPPFRVFRQDVTTGRREPWLDTSPPDPAGVGTINFSGAALTPDGRHYAYSYVRTLSDLFLIEGLRRRRWSAHSGCRLVAE